MAADVVAGRYYAGRRPGLRCPRYPDPRALPQARCRAGYRVRSSRFRTRREVSWLYPAGVAVVRYLAVIPHREDATGVTCGVDVFPGKVINSKCLP